MPSSIPILDLSLVEDTYTKQVLLQQLRAALFDVGFLYVTNHGVSAVTIDRLTSLLPLLFALPPEEKAALGKSNTPHFLGYSGFAEETTFGKQDLREQFDYATELPTVWRKSESDCSRLTPSAFMAADSTENILRGDSVLPASRDFNQLFWRLRGPNQWPEEKKHLCPAFEKH